MKKSRLLSIILVVCLLLLVGGGIYFWGQSVAVGYAYADKYTAGDTTVAETVENLDVHWTAGKINVEYYDGEGIRVSETCPQTLNEDEKLRWWLDGTTLRIQYEKDGVKWFVFNKKQKELTVSLPKGLELKTAAITTTSADQNISALSAGEVNLNSTSGEIKAAVTAGKLTAISTSGDMEITQEGKTDTVKISSTSGDISLTAAGAKNITADATSGSISLKLNRPAETVILHSTSGNIIPTIAGADKAEFSTTSGNVQVKAEAFGDMKINCTSGDVTAALATEPGFTCTVSQTSGDFNSALSLTKDGNIYTCGDGSARCSISTTSGDVTLEGIQ